MQQPTAVKILMLFRADSKIKENNLDYDIYKRFDLIVNPHANNIQVTQINSDELLAKVKRYTGYYWREVDFCMGNYSGSSNGQVITSRVIPHSPKSADIHVLLNLTAPFYTHHIDAVSKITNGLGEEKRLYYSPLFAVPVFTGKLKEKESCSQKSLPFPVINNPGIMNIVTKYEQEVEQDKFLRIRYYYSGPRYHKLRKGFLGFESVTELNDLNSTRKQAFYKMDENRFYVYNNKVEVRSTVNDYHPLISIIEKNYGFRNYNVNTNLRFFPFLISSIINTYNGESYNQETPIKRHKKVFEQYDDYGNPKLITDYYGNGSSGWPISKVSSISYLNLNNSTIYKTGLITCQTDTYKKTGEADKISRKEYSYYTSTGMLESKTTEPTNLKKYQNHYTYDLFGNPLTTKLTGAGMEDRITQTIYSSDGRFLKHKINALGHVTLFDYYKKIGLLKTITDENNMITTCDYNIFGELTKTIEPDGNVTRIVKRWTIPGTTYHHEDAPETAYYYVWKKRSGSSEKLTFYNQFGKKLRNVSINLNGSLIYNDLVYNGKIEILPYLSGLLHQTSLPYFKGGSPQWKTFSYDELQRKTRIEKPDGSFSTIAYEDNTKTVRDFDGQVKKLEYNGADWLTKVTNNGSTYVTYRYYSNGLEHETKINDIEETKISKYYDDFGNLELYSDYNKNGSTSYIYNPFGEIEKETKVILDDNDKITEFHHDKLGRMIWRGSPDGEISWIYDTKPNGVGKLDYVQYTPANGNVTTLKEDYFYDKYSRMVTDKQILNGDEQQFSFTFDIHGRIKQTVYPSGYKVVNIYDNDGFLFERRDGNEKKLWHADAMNANGYYTACKLGENVATTRNFDDASGLITNITAGWHGSTNNIQNFEYKWSTIGNMEYRKDLNKNLTENFTDYDAFNRLTNSFVSSSSSLTIGYDNVSLGNIVQKSDVGDYTYGTNPGYDAGSYAVVAVTNPHGTISSTEQNITYTNFDKVKTITEGNKSLAVCYDFNHDKVWQQLTDNNQTTTKRYFGKLFETKTTSSSIRQLHYLYAPTGLFAIFTVDNDNVETLNYILTDHFGSITNVLDEAGGLLEEQNFDAWGRRRNPANWTYNYLSSARLYDRGFTGHEHLDAFKLIDMKGRVYDPVTARFLSLDPVVQHTANSQSYNRYSYALNNPLKYTDPTGYSIDWFINQFTGEVKYNSALGKDDADKIEGEGWEWFGDDDVFLKNNPNVLNGTYGILWNNKNLMENPNSIMPHEGSFNLEATFKGQKALTFMKRMGYEFKPKEYLEHAKIKTVHYPDAIPITQKYTLIKNIRILSNQYVPKNYNRKVTYSSHYKPPIYGPMTKYTLFDPSFSFTDETWINNVDIYSEGNNIDKYINKGIQIIEELGIPWKELLKEYWEKKYK